MAPEFLPDPCPGCGQHHELEPAPVVAGPFTVALFISEDGTWSIHTTLPRMETLAALNSALRSAGADLS